MALLQFNRKPEAAPLPVNPQLEAFLKGYSIEVMPRTAAKIEDFKALLPKGTRVYIAHIEGTPVKEMVATAARLSKDGFEVMPHFPARIIADRTMLADWISRYRCEAGVTQALLLAGGVAKPLGEFASSMQLLETGLFDSAGFTNLHFAGHPEGNRDIDPGGSDKNVMDALRWKQDFTNRTDAKTALATRFVFQAKPVIEWADALKDAGIDMPIHLGIAGPGKLQTLVKFAIACGVGPSLKVLQKHARDMTRLMLPFEPTDLLTELAAYKAENPDSNIARVHFFPLGGIKTNANWAIQHGGKSAAPANQIKD